MYNCENFLLKFISFNDFLLQLICWSTMWCLIVFISRFEMKCIVLSYKHIILWPEEGWAQCLSTNHSNSEFQKDKPIYSRLTNSAMLIPVNRNGKMAFPVCTSKAKPADVSCVLMYKADKSDAKSFKNPCIGLYALDPNLFICKWGWMAPLRLKT